MSISGNVMNPASKNRRVTKPTAAARQIIAIIATFKKTFGESPIQNA